VRCTLRRAVLGLAAIRTEVPLWQVDHLDFLRWFEQARSGGRSPASMAKDASHVRGFLDYAWRSGRAQCNALDGFNLHDAVPKSAPEFLTEREAEQLVRACPRRDFAERRSRLAILLLYGCGLRTNELCQLDVVDINRERQELIVRKGKGDKRRVVPIPEGLYSELLAYLLELNHKRGPLFRTAHLGRRIRAREVCDIVSAACARAGLTRPITARTLRHSFATHLMDRGVDLAVIASLMGHRSPNETGVYLHVLPSRTQAAVATLVMRATPTKSRTGEAP
jgi:integrase/recombinase XerD